MMQERRLYPRFPWACELELFGQHGSRFVGSSDEVSVTGMGLQLDRASVLGLAQSTSILAPGDRLRIRVAAGASGILKDLDLSCRVREVRRLSIDQYLVGTWFENLDAASGSLLEELVGHAKRLRWG